MARVLQEDLVVIVRHWRSKNQLSHLNLCQLDHIVRALLFYFQMGEERLGQIRLKLLGELLSGVLKSTPLLLERLVDLFLGTKVIRFMLEWMKRRFKE